MKVAVCGSMTLIDEMEALARALRDGGAEVMTPVREESLIEWDALDVEEATQRKRSYLVGYLEVVRRSDVVLIANFEKRGIPGYIGPNSLVEAAFGRALGKPVVFLHRPGEQSCRLEALALMTVCLDGLVDNLTRRLGVRDGL